MRTSIRPPLIVAAFALVLFVLLAWQAESETHAFDRWLLLALRDTDPSVPVGPAWLSHVMVAITTLGATPVLAGLALVTALYLALSRHPATAGLLVAAVTSGLLVHSLLKRIFDRDRPDIVEHLVDTHTSSFPSGHAFNATMVYLLLGTVVAQTERLLPWRVQLMTLAGALAFFIGFSRLYLGVHWPSDVLAGWCGGIVWAIGWSLILRR